MSPKFTVFDLIKPDSWVVVKRKKFPRWTMAGSRPPATELETPSFQDLGIADYRQRRLNSLLGREGLPSDVGGPAHVGSGIDGYEAQSIPGPTGFFCNEGCSERAAVHGSEELGYEAQSTLVEKHLIVPVREGL